MREAYTTEENTQDRREKIQALSLAKECYSIKIDLLTNVIVVDDAIRFLYSRQKEDQWQISSSEEQEWEKAKANDLVIEREGNSSDIQGSEKEDKQQHPRYTTTNQNLW